MQWVRLEQHLSSAASWLPKARLVLAEDNQQFSHKQDKKKKKVRVGTLILPVRQLTEDGGIILAATLMW